MGSKLIGGAQFFLDELSAGPETDESNANLIGAGSHAVPKPNKQASVQLFESVRLQKIEARHDNISGQMLTVATYSNAFHFRSTCSLNACECVFYHYALLGRYSDPSGGRQMHLGIWFASVYVLR